MNKQNSFSKLQKLDSELFILLADSNIKSKRFDIAKTTRKVNEYCSLLDKFNRTFRDFPLVQNGLHYYNITFLKNRLADAKTKYNRFKEQSRKEAINHMNNVTKSNVSTQSKEINEVKPSSASYNDIFVLIDKRKLFIKTAKNDFKSLIFKCERKSNAYKMAKKYLNDYINQLNDCYDLKELYELHDNFNLARTIDSLISEEHLKELRLYYIRDIKTQYQQLISNLTFAEKFKYGGRLKNLLEVATLDINNNKSEYGMEGIVKSSYREMLRVANKSEYDLY